MNILIVTDRQQDRHNDAFHCGEGLYVQFVSIKANKPEDIAGVHWDVAIAENSTLNINAEWVKYLTRHSKKVYLK